MVFEYFREKKQKKEARKAYLDSLESKTIPAKVQVEKDAVLINLTEQTQKPAEITTQSYAKLPEPTIEIPKFKSGRIYFIEEPKYDLTARLVKEISVPTLWTDRVKPEHLMQDYGLELSKDLTFVWMKTDIRFAEDNCVPISLEYIKGAHGKFLEQNENNLLVIGSLHELIDRADFDSYSKFLDSLQDNIAAQKGNAYVLIPANPKTIKREYLDKLEQGREVIAKIK